MSKKKLTEKNSAELISTLKTRFDENMSRHKGMKWAEVEKRLTKNPEKLWSISEMERTGGEPDVIAYDKKSDQFTFCDCSEETPKERRSVCYDDEALRSRKENKPKNSAVSFAKEMGIELLGEDDYRHLQTLGEFDLKTSSWILTPTAIRRLKGALFCDRRYDHVFTYHNGAESYYAARGFRGLIRV